MQDQAWYTREVDRRYIECHKKYFKCSSKKRVYVSPIEKYKFFRPVAEMCFEQGIRPKLYVEAQFDALALFYQDKGVTSLPACAINTSKVSVERYNKFLKENKLRTGSAGVSPKDIIEDDSDEKKKSALLRYGIVLFKTGSHKIARKNARLIDPGFKVVADSEIAMQALYSLNPAVVPYLQFKDGWTWAELRETLLELTVING